MKGAKILALVLVLSLVVIGAAACGVPEEDELEDDFDDDFGLEGEVVAEEVDENDALALHTPIILG